MPITGPTSFVPTLNLFIPHWVDVDAVLGIALGLEDGTTLAILIGYRDDLDDFRLSVMDKANDVQITDGFMNCA